jgi:hypothetical protein
MSFVQCMILNNTHSAGTISSSAALRNDAVPVKNTLLFSQNQSQPLTHQPDRSLPTEEPDHSTGSCKECLYTGVLTCSGVSLYFLKLASEVPEQGTKEMLRQATKQKRFLLGGSALWAAAGAYRMYLGWRKWLRCTQCFPLIFGFFILPT